MKYKEKAKKRLIIAEVAYLIVIVILLFKCSDDIVGVKPILGILVGSYICGTIVTVILYLVDTRIIHKTIE